MKIKIISIGKFTSGDIDFMEIYVQKLNYLYSKNFFKKAPQLIPLFDNIKTIFISIRTSYHDPNAAVQIILHSFASKTLASLQLLRPDIQKLAVPIFAKDKAALKDSIDFIKKGVEEVDSLFRISLK